MNARGGIWRWIEAHRDADILLARPRQIAEATGIGLEWVRTILEHWCDEGCLVRLEPGRYRIDGEPTLTGWVRGDAWSDADKRKLAALSAAGLPLREIAQEMRTTINAVAGKRKRMGLPKRPSPIPAKGPA